MKQNRNQRKTNPLHIIFEKLSILQSNIGETMEVS